MEVTEDLAVRAWVRDRPRHRRAPLSARRVVLATIGLSYFAHMPAALSGLPPELASHTFFHADYARFAGKEVAVLGAGASAIEAGALLHEAGGAASGCWSARARRSSAAGWSGIGRSSERLRHLELGARPTRPQELGASRRRSLWARASSPNGTGCASSTGTSAPAAPWWIHDRVAGKVPIHVNTEVVASERAGDRARLRLYERGAGEREVEVDHVVAGTGYDFDVDRLSMLAPDLRARIRRVERAPALSLRFESSVSGLYFIGPVSCLSFGPLFRFVCGAAYAAPALALHLATSAREATGAPRRWASVSRSPTPG